MTEDGKCRAAFEEWFSGGEKNSPAVERSGDSYKYMTAHSSWIAWKEAWSMRGSYQAGPHAEPK